MAVKFETSAHGQASLLVLMIAWVSGLSPLLISGLIDLPLWPASQQIPLPVDPMSASIAWRLS